MLQFFDVRNLSPSLHSIFSSPLSPFGVSVGFHLFVSSVVGVGLSDEDGGASGFLVVVEVGGCVGDVVGGCVDGDVGGCVDGGLVGDCVGR